MASSVSFPRLFTVGEANALLPAVRGLTERIQENIQRLKNKSKIVIRDEQLDPGAADFMDRLQENSEIARLVSEVKDGVDQIQSYGCICKGAEQGLVDFPCMLGAEVVFLCWQQVNRLSAIGTGSKRALPGADPCSMSRKRAPTKKLLTINRSILRFGFLYFCSLRVNPLLGWEVCDRAQ